MIHLLKESTVSVNDYFSSRAEMLTCLNRMIFIYFGQFANYSELLRCYSGMGALIDSPLDHAPNIVVQKIHFYWTNPVYETQYTHENTKDIPGIYITAKCVLYGDRLLIKAMNNLTGEAQLEILSGYVF